MAAFAAAPPQAVTPAPVEEVLITGSLFTGVAPVGVPVNALGPQDFQETGALTVSEMLFSVPTLFVEDSNNITNSGSDRGREQKVVIHNLGTTDATESLMLVNSMRYPTQGAGISRIDPSIIPQLAIQRIDLLTNGASATYGSDAVAGVLNVILKRGFDGAITALRGSIAPGLGAPSLMFSQQYGTVWDSGGITLTYEFYNEKKVVGTAREYLTRNLEPYGLDDRNALAANMPGVVTTGAPAAPASGVPSGFSANIGTRFCVNCYSIPAGTGWNFGDRAPAPTTTWTQLLANKGVLNQRNPYAEAWLLPENQRNALVMTFDQELVEDLFGLGPLELFADAFYSNRRSVIYYPSGNSPAAEQWTSAAGITVPTTNPYYPAGAPANLRIHYSLGAESPMREMAGNIAGRYAVGFSLDELPFDWAGRAFYSMSREGNFVHDSGNISRNHFTAALGNTVASAAADGTIPGQAAFVKPANIPFLNVFCDPTVYRCNSQATLDYMRAYRDRDEHWNLTEIGANLEGPVWELPGGPVQLALGANKISNHFAYTDVLNNTTHNKALLNAIYQVETGVVWAVMGEVNVPIFGEANAIPLFNRLVFTAAYRFDKYDYLSDYVKTPKFGLDWGLGYGLTLYGNWGTAFRAPNFSERAQYVGSRITGINQLGGQTSDTVLTNCASVSGSTPGVALAGSVTAILNPNCIGGVGSSVQDPTGQFSRPGGIIITGGGGIAAATVDPGGGVGPSSATSWAVGGTFAPTEGVLAGLFANVSYYNIKIEDQLGLNTAGLGVNDPVSAMRFIVINDPTRPITDPVNADFLEKVQRTMSHPRSDIPASFLPNIKFIQVATTTNIGYLKISGVEFDTRYDWDMGNWGAWNVGFNGVYRLTDEQQSVPTVAVDDKFKGKNSGGRLRGRGRLGWTDGAWNWTAFVNYFPHSTVDAEFTPPPCYWLTGNSAGSCYPGSPFVGPYDVFPNRSPEQFIFDLAFGYQTGDRPANSYLHNVAFQVTVTNLLDRRPPFHYDTRASSGYPRAFDTQYNPLQRKVSFAITKVW